MEKTTRIHQALQLASVLDIMVDKSKSRGYKETQGRDIPTPFSSMIFWALTLAADIAAGDVGVKDPKRRRIMEAMVGNWCLGIPEIKQVKRLDERGFY